MGTNLYAVLCERVLPLTEGNKGKPAYRTNPITGNLYSKREKEDNVNKITMNYDLSYLESLLKPKQQIYDVQC